MSTDLQQLIFSLLQAKGQALVVSLVKGFTLLPVYLCVDSSEVLWLLLSRFREVLCHYLCMFSYTYKCFVKDVCVISCIVLMKIYTVLYKDTNL